VQLSETRAAFDKLGIQLAAMTYDPVATNKRFADQYHIEFPLLTDVNVRYVKAFGILNESYQPGHRAYGIPHPGIFLVDRDGNVYAKFWRDDYRERPEIADIIDAATEMVRHYDTSTLD
jgi:peroxiredoxin